MRLGTFLSFSSKQQPRTEVHTGERVFRRSQGRLLDLRSIFSRTELGRTRIRDT